MRGRCQCSRFGDAQEQAALARQEIDDLLRRDDDGLAADVLGLLTAAAGPLAVRDLAAMTTAAPQSRCPGTADPSAAHFLGSPQSADLTLGRVVTAISSLMSPCSRTRRLTMT